MRTSSTSSSSQLVLSFSSLSCKNLLQLASWEESKELQYHFKEPYDDFTVPDGGECIHTVLKALMSSGVSGWASSGGEAMIPRQRTLQQFELQGR